MLTPSNRGHCVDLPEFVEKYWSHVTLVAGAGWAGLWKIADWRSKTMKERIEASAAEQVAKLDLNKYAQEAVAFAVKTLSEQVERQAARIEEQDEVIRSLNDRVNEVLSDHSHMVSSKDAELAVARGKIRELETEVSALKRSLELHGISIPLMFQAFEVQDNELKSMGDPDA